MPISAQLYRPKTIIKSVIKEIFVPFSFKDWGAKLCHSWRMKKKECKDYFQLKLVQVMLFCSFTKKNALLFFLILNSEVDNVVLVLQYICNSLPAS